MAGSKNSSNHIKSSPGDQTVQVLIYIFIGAFAIACVVPFIYVFAGSFATEKELTERPFFLIPHEFSLNAYRYVTKTGDVFFGLKNSLIVTAVGVIINMFFTTTFAYPLSRPYLRGRNGFINIVIITMLFGGGMIPAYLLVSSLNLLDTYWALWLPGAISAFNFIIVKNYFQGLPMELEEAAKIDGCNDFAILRRIILPLSKPILAVLCLYYAVGHWNDYFNAMIYVNNKNYQTLQVFLREILLLNQNIDLNTVEDPAVVALKLQMAQVMKYSLIVVSSIPLLIAYPFVQKFFVKGVMIGSVKG